MKIIAYALGAYNIVGTGFSIIGGINHAIKHFCKTTAEELFKKSLDKVVKKHASDFADLTEPKTVKIDPHTFDNVIASLKDEDENQFASVIFNSSILLKITLCF